MFRSLVILSFIASVDRLYEREERNEKVTPRRREKARQLKLPSLGFKHWSNSNINMVTQY